MGRYDIGLRSHRKPTNISLDTALVAEAKRLGINISRACESGLSDQIAREQARLWKADNASALESSNDYVDRHGLPLSRHRHF
ncbi:type II toxin-antitoxin system CcdA family antitoxin [Sphingobium sp. DC-2]|uniref:type II toxin-antitoxin system CcdA family antitoxin n=1 Tax=Sphingobium sp. DC-2 TaxID=1303256 RepID=UPI0004C3DEE2|nr:type II toxin-antitoxin system CcdA family antitoxin [Sphingobium sp. DC-2]